MGDPIKWRMASALTKVHIRTRTLLKARAS